MEHQRGDQKAIDSEIAASFNGPAVWNLPPPFVSTADPLFFNDALSGYREGISFAFGSKKPEHIAKAGIKKPHATNNRIERLNGTLRERVKVQRGWKTMKTPLAEGQRIHYNFVKPHAALEGQTPAQVAGVGFQGNKWMELLKRSIERIGNQAPST